MSEKWLALKNRFYFSFFLEKLSIKFRGKKVSGRRISTTESLRCARNSDREAEEPQIVLLFVSTASRRGCRKSSGVPHYPRKHSKISWTKWCKKIRRKERRGELDRINPEGKHVSVHGLILFIERICPTLIPSWINETSTDLFVQILIKLMTNDQVCFRVPRNSIIILLKIYRVITRNGYFIKSRTLSIFDNPMLAILLWFVFL